MAEDRRQEEQAMIDLNRGRMWIVVSATLLVPLTVGCVTRGKFNDLEAEKQTVQADRDALAQELAGIQSERDALMAGLAEAEAEKAAMSGTYSELVGELQSEVAAGQVEIQQIIDGVRLNVSDELLFSSGSVTLGDAGSDVLIRVAGQIKDEAAITSVEGHTDNVRVGPSLRKRFPTNWELAAARAAVVTRLLAENGVDPTRLRSISRGPFAPVASNDTEEGRAKNRRTEIILRPIAE